MYYKISSLILNSGKTGDFSDVFVAQPDALKENLAGKVFILAEVSGKKAEGRKIFNFLLSAIEDYYYHDEKILLRDKIEGLKIENIFEASLTKINKGLADFLAAEKIKINPAAIDLTLGVIYENKLHFSSFGRNKALLIYRRGEEYEMINVETSAADITNVAGEIDRAEVKMPNFFSSVISGEVPSGSYFMFTSESLPEYLSAKEMIDIITKLPPMTAAEQIKNVLARINTYVPFLGIIIKNTVGLGAPELKEEQEEPLSGRSSISALNDTEQKTEQMLAPTGLISLSKISKGIKETVKGWRTPVMDTRKSSFSAERGNYENQESRASQPPLNLGTINSLKKNLSLARSDSFLVKEKVFLRGESSPLATGFKKTGRFFSGLFGSGLGSGAGSEIGTGTGTGIVSGTAAGIKSRLKSLNTKNRLVFSILGTVILIFIVSLLITGWKHKRQIAQENFDNLMSEIQKKEEAISSHLLYDDNTGAGTALEDATALLASLPQETKDQQAAYQQLSEELKAQEEKINKITRAVATEVNNLSGLGVNSLVFAGGRVYAAGGNLVYGLTSNSASSTKTEISGTSALSNPQFDRKDSVYYWDNDQVAQFSLKSGIGSVIKVANPDAAAGLTGFKIFNGNLYLIAKTKNQIYVYKRSADTFGATDELRTNWLKEDADLSRAVDLGIDGSIYVLENNGQVLKFHLGKKVEYPSATIAPAMTGANKFIVGSKYIYIFEVSSKRLVVLAKVDGHLVGQYIVDSLNQPSDFTVDEDGRAAYFLDGEKLYRMELNQ